MNYDFKQTMLSKSILSGLFAGFVAVISNFIFNYIYRVISGFSLSEVVNVVSIIFSSILVTLVAGVIYFLLSKVSGNKIIYMVLFIALTALGVYAATQTGRTNLPADEHEFRILFAGLILIDGLCATFLVPYLVDHETIYS